jgi:nicotinamidase-related amidase
MQLKSEPFTHSSKATSMTTPKTLLEMIGVESAPSALSHSALILIDCQNTYKDGPVKLVGMDNALVEIQKLISRSRKAGSPIIHIRHDAGPGSPYDVQGETGAIITEVAPEGDEPTITKKHPNSFFGTDLHERLQKLNINKLIIVGFMTHCCVSSTVRAGFDLGYQMTVIGEATATRDLKSATGNVIPAMALRDSSLAGISDIFACVISNSDQLPD